MKTEELNLSSLKYFFDAVETKSLTKAAALNYVTRSAIGQAITRLETWADKQLLFHKQKNFMLTKDGEEFYRQMKDSFLLFKNAIEAPLKKDTSLKIGCSTSLAESFLIPRLKKLESIEHLNLVTGTSKQLGILLDEEKINISLFVSEERTQSQKVIKKGKFIVASKDGKPKNTIVTTEKRAEVRALERNVINKSQDFTFLTVESWSISQKLAQELNYACLIPDFMMAKGMNKIPLRGFDQPYQIVIETVSNEKLSSLEVELLKQFEF